MERERESVALAVGVLAALGLGMALIPVRGLTAAANFTFAFMALTIAVAEWGGRGAAVATAFASALSLDFFLTRPYLELSMAEKDDVIAFVGLTLCGLVAAAFGSGSARRAAAVRHRELLQRALRLLEEGGPPAASFVSALEAARAILPVAALSVRDLHGVLVAGTGAAAGRGVAAKRLRPDTLVGEGEPDRAPRRGRPLPAEGGRLELLAGNRIVGALELWGNGEGAAPEERQALTSLARAIAARLALVALVLLLTTSLASAQGTQSTPLQYGAFGDLAYLRDFNDPSNHLFRSRGTAWHVNEWDLNMAGAYVKRKASDASRWGGELLLQAGKDDEVFGFSATAPNLGGYRWLRHVGLANVSYLAPVGKGLTMQGGIFSSFIGYDSLYAKDNLNYTRPWGADFTPYLMLGVNASYPFSDRLTGSVFVLNGYWHLANANSVPSSGGQLAYKVTPRTTLKQTVLYGPHQSNTSLEFWRLLSDSIGEWKGDRVTLALEYQVSAERIDAPGRPRAWWMAAQLPMRWNVHGPWSVAVRPEVAWDSEGRWTLYKQTVKAVTTTLEYRHAYRGTNTILRLEHRYDDSRGRDGGFFTDGEAQPGVIGLTPGQHIALLGLMFTFDRP